jgi:hypothetical protein
MATLKADVLLLKKIDIKFFVPVTERNMNNVSVHRIYKNK